VTALSIAILILSAVVIVSTFLPLVPTHAGIVRMCDFPRPQILTAALIALIGTVAAFEWQSWIFGALVLLLSSAFAVQASRILPYLPLMRKETRAATPGLKETEITLLIANVKQDNRHSAKLVDLIETRDPDIVFIVEADVWWEEQLRPITARYPHVTSLPQNNGYGLVFMTRLAVESCEVRRLVQPEIPSVKAKLRLPSGERFWFYGVHPEPPGPIQDAEDRDAELLIVAREMRDDGHASIVGGDLNDVAWSRTTSKFQRLAKALDPRRGRGFYATFHADYWIARWPIDHLFHTKEFSTATLEVLPHIGSDHFPVFVRLTWSRRHANTVY